MNASDTIRRWYDNIWCKVFGHYYDMYGPPYPHCVVCGKKPPRIKP